MAVYAQTARLKDTNGIKHTVDSVNRLLDRAVVKKQAGVLQKHYAGDFVFTHGTGQVDSKSSWVKHVLDTAAHFLHREHDSVVVDPHNGLAVVSGTLTVHNQQQNKLSKYGLRYVRVFMYRNRQWQLVSHRTVAEWHFD